MAQSDVTIIDNTHVVKNREVSLRSFRYELFDEINLKKLLAELKRCYEEALKNRDVLKHFGYNTSGLDEILIKSVRRAKSEENVNANDRIELYKIILNLIGLVNTHTYSREELRRRFIDSLIEPVSEMVFDIGDAQYPLPFQDVVAKVLFADPPFRRAFVNELFSTSSDSSITDIVTSIRNYPTRFTPDILRCAYSLLLGSFLQNETTASAKFRVFLALNSFIRMRPVALDEQNPKCVIFGEHVHTCIKLLEYLLHHDIPLECTAQSVSLIDWLKELIEAIFNELMNNLSSPVIQLLEIALRFDPGLVENNLRKLVKHVMLPKKSDSPVMVHYETLCSTVFAVYVKKNRLHKLISALLMAMKENLNMLPAEDLPSKFEILPEKILEEIQTAVTYLPNNSQSVDLMQALLYHFKQDCIAELEKEESQESDAKSVLLCEIVSCLICRVVDGTRIMDCSVLEVTQSKFIATMDQLAALLGRYGQVVVSKKHNPKLIGSFLDVCNVWGDMQLLIVTYESAPRKVTLQSGTAGTAATNLVYLHPYLSENFWNPIAQRVANFGDEHCRRQLNNLVLQKMDALVFIESESGDSELDKDGLAAACVTYLMNHADVEWIFDHVSVFVHLLRPENIQDLSVELVNYWRNSDRVEISRALPPDRQEIGPLVVAMICSVFTEISGDLKKGDVKELSFALRRLNYVSVIAAEMEEPISLKSELDSIAELISSDVRWVEEVENFDTHTMERLVDLLLLLPAQDLSLENKTLVCLLTLCSMKCFIQLQKVENTKGVLEKLARFLQSILQDVQLPNKLNCGMVIMWLHFGLKNTPYRESTMRELCQTQRNYDSEENTVLEIVSSAVGGQPPREGSIKSCNDGLDFVTSYLVHFQGARKRKNDNSEQETVKKMKVLCYENLDRIFGSKREEGEQLALYTQLLADDLESENTDRVEQLLSILPKFIAFVEDNFDSNRPEISQFLLVILRHIPRLKSSLPDDFILCAWEYRWYLSEDEVITSFLRMTSLEDYEGIIRLLLAHTDGSLDRFEEYYLPIFRRVWKLVLNTSVKRKKMRAKQDAVYELCALAQKYMIVVDDHYRDPTHRAIVMILTEVLQNNDLAVCYSTVDVCFNFLASAVSANPSIELLKECVEMLFVFCLVRRSMLLDRIPAFYVCYRSLFVQILRIVERKCENTEELSRVVHKLEKLTDYLVKLKKDFSKTAINAVGDLLTEVIDTEMDERVESQFKNIIRNWISLCDLHGMQCLSTTIPPVALEQLKQYELEYRKFYKFTGQV